MKSIQSKFILLTVIAIILSVSIIGGFAVVNFTREAEYSSTAIMNLTCQEQMWAMNKQLASVSESVDIMGDYVKHRLFSVDKMKNDPDYRESFEEQMALIFEDLALSTPPCVSFYIRYDSELLGGQESEVLRVRKDEFSPFEDASLEDVTQYDADSGNVRWWFDPIETGTGTWIAPYYDKDMDMYLISYVRPLYEDDQFLGIAGMDIDFSKIVATISDIKVYETGYAYLTDTEGTIIYHPVLKEGTTITDSAMELQSAISFFEKNNSEGTTLTYTFNGVKKQMAFATMSNGMRIVIAAPDSEIKGSVTNITRQTVLSGLLIIAIFSFVIMLVCNRIVKPLKKLVAAAEQIISGNFEVDFPPETKDEVGTLTVSMKKMVGHLKRYINELNGLAFRDSLTGVKNKTAYDSAIADLNRELEEQNLEFGLVICDTNNLKHINDTYGHEQGNLYLQKACRLICEIYKNSPVYRIGGDEFAVILKGKDYQNRYQLMESFDEEAEAQNRRAQNPWDEIHVARGMVFYEPGRDVDAEAVFRRADAKMYLTKQKMKMGADFKEISAAE
ncbi:MAG: diguanylate cyclase [Lachnospiraceae bacterium]|nr:diguanylate cyclase [Lachnospiraceae bacterium]